MVLEALDIRQKRTMIPERRESNDVSPVTAPVYCPEKDSSPVDPLS